jgi:phage terminase large subunit
MSWQDEYLPKQLEALAHLSNASDCESILYGGSAGSGKSWFGCRWQVMRRIKYPGTRGLIGRSKLDTLKKTTLRTFFEVCGQLKMESGKHYTFNAQSNIISFYNGSEIILKDLFAYPSDPNFDSLGSLEITDAFIDEVAQVSQKGVSIVQSRVRFKLIDFCKACSSPGLNKGVAVQWNENGHPTKWRCEKCGDENGGILPKTIMTCNPSRGWLYNDYYKPWRDGNLPDHKVFVPALPGDNYHLPESYLDTLSRLPEQDRRRLRS